ncbi:MAG TPA: Arm DNA-binding domain-containing protein, partial [Puia sp.]|nr:Arm DNA-binding domain-containing protein [Puia sp.]
MRTSHSFSIEFLKRGCRGRKKKGKAHIYARIWVDGEAAEISLKEEINEKDWDPQAEQVKGRNIQVKSLNDHIDCVRDKIRNKYR